MHDQTQQSRSFLHKRRQLILKDVRNRRQLIFNQTRQIINNQTRQLIINDHERQQKPQTFCIGQHQQINQQQLLSCQYQHSHYQQKKQQHYHVDNQCQQPKRQLNQQPLSQSQLSSPNKQKRNTKHKQQHHQQYYKNFQSPQWLIDNILQDMIIDRYYFCLRPLGQRVFVHIKKRKMIILSMYANVIETIWLNKGHYHDCLFEGYYVRRTNIGCGGQQQYKDGINTNNISNIKNSIQYNISNNIKNNNLLVLTDLLIWKQNPMTCSEFQFRQMWLINNFNQHTISQLLVNSVNNNNNINNNNNNNNSNSNSNNNSNNKNNNISNNNHKPYLRIKLMSYWPLLSNTLHQQWSNNNNHIYHQYNNNNGMLEYTVDGILFYEKDSYYMHGVNPQLMLWKDCDDMMCSKMDQRNFSKKFSTLKQQQSSIFIQQQRYQQQESKQQQKCQYQLNSLTLQQQFNINTINNTNTNNISNNQNNLSFYSQLVIKQNTPILYTLDSVPLINIQQLQIQQESQHQYYQQNRLFVQKIKSNYLKNNNKSIIVRFGFQDIVENEQITTSHYSSQQTKQQQNNNNHPSTITEHNNYLPYKFINFKIISLHALNYRIPDPLTKILCKYNTSKKRVINFQTLIQKISSKQRSKDKLSITSNKQQQHSMEIQ